MDILEREICSVPLLGEKCPRCGQGFELWNNKLVSRVPCCDSHYHGECLEMIAGGEREDAICRCCHLPCPYGSRFDFYAALTSPPSSPLLSPNASDVDGNSSGSDPTPPGDGIENEPVGGQRLFYFFVLVVTGLALSRLLRKLV
ncbi:hypothetical protein FNV43_RR08071 [Rhamnella rubrinervis]|uniref:Uncharacterized protein n=1 Tax=Rhamnella rubrinervis TaxID=2594499 RepID=A0A8K0HGI5_9ROSA|nr:hypothetical protein FNV43_RR08071 [Rhamnella rubrinervis]